MHEPPPTINPLTDDLLPDSATAKRLGVSPVTVWRWRKKGRCGVRLPSVPYRSGWGTTAEAIAWFYREIQRRQQEGDYSPAPRKRPGTLAEREALDAECAAAGI